MAKRLLSVERIVALPSDPAGAEGGLYYNSVSKVLRYHNGTSWTTLSGGSSGTGQFTGDTAPVSPVLGDIWFNTATGKTYVYYDSFWIEVGTSEGGRPLTLSGDVTGTGTDNIATTLGPSGVGAGTYGSTSAIPVLTIDVKGRVTAAGTAAISTTLTGLADVNAGVLADNDILSYNFATSKWVNQNLASAIAEVDGPTSGIDADLLDGQHGSYYTTAGNLTGTIPSAVLGTSSIFIGTTSIALNRGTGALTLAGITLSSPTFTGTVTTPLTTAGYVTTTSGGVLGSVATIPNVGLTNSTVTVGTTSIALGASSTTLAGLTSVAATTFTGALSGNATSATNATNTGITEDIATAVAVYPTWVTANTGNLPQKTTSTRLSFVPSTGILTATQFSGSGAGLTSIPQSGVTSLTSDLALKAPLASPTFTGTVTSPLFSTSAADTAVAASHYYVETASDGIIRPKTLANVKAEILAAPTLTGTITTSLTVAGYVTTTAGGVLGSVATIPNAGLTNPSVTIGSTAVALGATVTTFAGLTSVTSTTFVGALTGNASSATNATNVGITEDVATAVAVYPTWVTANTGNLPQRTTSTRLSFVPSTGVLTATQFSGSGAGLTSIPNGALTNSSVTVNGTAIALGASGTVTAAAGTLTGTTLNATVTGSSLTSVGTITTGTWNATDIALGAGGTNASLTAINGGVVYSTASAMAITAAGNSGEFLKSNGAGAPTWAAVVGGASYQTTAPGTPSVGQLWVDSDEVVTTLNSNDFLLKSGGTMTGNLVVGGNLSVTGTFSGEQFMIMALSDETTALTTGTAKLTWRAPFALTLTQIPRASLATASTSGLVTVDINEAGTSVLGVNKLSIDANEKTSTTAATPTTLADTSIADDAEITFDIDAAGTGAKGLRVILYYKRT